MGAGSLGIPAKYMRLVRPGILVYPFSLACTRPFAVCCRPPCGVHYAGGQTTGARKRAERVLSRTCGGAPTDRPDPDHAGGGKAAGTCTVQLWGPGSSGCPSLGNWSVTGTG